MVKFDLHSFCFHMLHLKFPVSVVRKQLEFKKISTEETKYLMIESTKQHLDSFIFGSTMLYCRFRTTSKVLNSIPLIGSLLVTEPLSAKGINSHLLRIFLFSYQSKYPHLYSWTIMSDLKTTNTYHPLSTWINYLDLPLHSQFEWII